MPIDPTVFTAIPLSELLQLFGAMLDNKLKEFISIKKQEPEEALSTIEEVCALLQVSKVTIHKWKKAKRIKSYRIGRRIYFKKSELLAALR
jgi:excisionase family DNA binding protein